MSNLIKRFFYVFCFYLAISNSYAADIDPSNPPSINDNVPVDVYNDQVKTWLKKHEDGRAFLASGYEFPSTRVQYNRGKKPLEAYKAFYAMKQAQKHGAADQLGSTLKPTLQASLGLKDEHFAGSADVVMSHVATALAAQKEKADREQDAQRRLAEEQSAKARALQDVDASQRERERLERGAEEQQAAQRVLEVQHMALRVHAGAAGIDVGEIERGIAERLERMQEENALNTALDSLRFLTHFVQRQADISDPLAQIRKLNERAKAFERALETRAILEKGELLLPIDTYFDIPFFAVYDKKFDTPEFKALQAWQVLQTSTKLSPADLSNIKSWATLKQKAKPDDKEKKEIEALDSAVSGFADKIEKDLLWQALKTAIPLYFDEVYFWSQIGKMHEFNKGAFVNIKGTADAYADFSTANKLKLLADDRLKSIAFKINAVRQELNPASTAAANFALFDDLGKSFKELVDQLKTYNAAVAAGGFANIPHVGKLTKLRLADIPRTLSIEDIHAMPNAVFARTLRTLESLSFCIKDTDPDAASFVRLSATSGKLLATVSSFIDQLQQYATEYHTKVATALAGGGADVLRDVKVLGYERPKPEEEKVEPPVTLKKCLAPVLEESAVEKEVKTLNRQIEKIRKDLQTQAELRKSQTDFEKIIALLKTQDGFLKINFSGPSSQFEQCKKLPSKPDAKLAILEEIFVFFEQLGQNSDLLERVLSSGIVSLDSNYKENRTLTKKDILDCVSDFARRSPESREVIIKVKDDRPESATIHIVPFFYYLCFELNNLLQAELKKIGASNVDKVLPHLGGLSGILKGSIDKAKIKAALNDHNFFKDIVLAKKIKFKPGSLVQLKIKRGIIDMKVEDFFELLPKLITAYTAQPATTPPLLSIAHTPPAVVSSSAPPAPPPPPPPGASGEKGPPPPPPHRAAVGSATPELGKDIEINDLTNALDFLSDNLTAMAIGPDDQIRDLEASKAQRISEITRERTAYITLTSSTWDQGAYNFLTGASNQVLIEYFRGIDCRKYLNTKDNSDGFIEKLYNEFMQSVEFILWNKIAEFGKSITERLLAAAGASVSAKKEEFVRTFGDTTLNNLVKSKLIKTEKANEIVNKVLPEPLFKVRQPKYAETFRDIDIFAPTAFQQIIDKHVADLQAKKAAAASGRVHQVSVSGDVFADALQKLKKSQDTRYTQTKQKIDKLLVDLTENYLEIKDIDMFAKIDAYIAAAKDGSLVREHKLSKNVTISLAQVHFMDICFLAAKLKNEYTITNIVYDFLKTATEEYVRGKVYLETELAAKPIDDDAARREFNRGYTGGEKAANFTVVNVLQNDKRVLPAIFQAVFNILALKGDGSQLDFAAHIVKEFLDKFPAFLTDQVNARLYADVGSMPQQASDGVAARAHQVPSSTAVSQQSAVDSVDFLKEKFMEASIPYAEKHTQLDITRPADIQDQKAHIVFEFLENTGIIDARYLDSVKRSYQTELVKIKAMSLSGSVIPRAEYEALQSSAANALEKIALEELLKQKHEDIRVVELLKLYSDNPQKLAIEALKNIQQGKKKFKLLERLDKFANGKNFWLEKQMDGLCAQGTKVFDFSRILTSIAAMPQDQFLDNFFGAAAVVEAH